MKLLRDFLVCFTVGAALFWLFFVYGLEQHFTAKEKAPWSKPGVLEQTAGFLDTARGR